jgi:hypothetical protein
MFLLQLVNMYRHSTPLYNHRNIPLFRGRFTNIPMGSSVLKLNKATLEAYVTVIITDCFVNSET